MANELDGKILELEETKLWLREDNDDPEVLKQISMLIKSAENYLYNATGVKYTSDNHDAKLYCLVLVTDWYENRELIGQKVSEKVRFTIQSMLAQLTYCKEDEDVQSY